MKRNTTSYSLFLLVIIFITNFTNAQVGINTTDPKGIVDFNSTTLGVVYPNVALTATDNPSPVVNPQGGALVDGTIVYNTNTTTTGLVTDVNPGIYAWDAVNSKWLAQYKKRQSELHNQTAVLRPEANFATDWEDVPGLGIADNKTFTANYSGLYRIEVKTNFAGGRTETNSSIFVSQVSGEFRFLFDGTPYNIETTAFSAYSSYIGSGTYYEGIWKESYITKYVTLTAGTTYDFSLCFDAYDAPGLIGNGSTTAGGDPTSLDLVNEDFEGVAIGQYADQTNTTDPQCTIDGWEVSLSNPCPTCTNKTLYINSEPNNCEQSATAFIGFTPSLATVDISFDYAFNYRNPGSDTFRVYLHDGTNQVGGNLFIHTDIDGAASYSGTIAVAPGIAHTINFEYINTGKGYYASVDNVVISELSGPPSPPSDLGRGYVGNEIDCQIEFTYIGGE